MIVGSSGFVGNYIMKTLAMKYPSVQVVGMSRSGRAREENTANLSNVSYVKGNVLEPESFREHLKDIDGVIHCVGTLIESRTDPKLSYNAMNRDSAINVAKVLNENGEKKGDHKKFVMISSEKAPPFLDAYLTSKFEAE
jgi:nucleoside-diphosphate-sugar epimerase